MVEAAKDGVIWEVLLFHYFDLQVELLGIYMMEGVIVAAGCCAFLMLRNRMLADPSFLFKVRTEVAAIVQLFPNRSVYERLQLRFCSC